MLESRTSFWMKASFSDKKCPHKENREFCVITCARGFPRNSGETSCVIQMLSLGAINSSVFACRPASRRCMSRPFGLSSIVMIEDGIQIEAEIFVIRHSFELIEPGISVARQLCILRAKMRAHFFQGVNQPPPGAGGIVQGQELLFIKSDAFSHKFTSPFPRSSWALFFFSPAVAGF